MPIPARCRECGKQYRIKDELAGEVLPCKDCGADFRVPRPKSKPVAAVVFDDDDDEDGSPGGGATPWIIGGSVAGVLLLGAAVGLIIFTMKKDEDGGDRPADNAVARNDDDNDDNDNDDDDREPPAANPDNRGRMPDNRNEDNNRGLPNANGDRNPGRNPPPVNRNPQENRGGIRRPPIKRNNPPINRPPVRGNGKPGGLIPAGNDVNAGRDFGGADAVRWSVRVDPPSAPFEFSAKGKLKLPAPDQFFANALYPSTNSAYVALGSNTDEKAFRNVYDLQTNKQIGQIGGVKLGFTPGVLSQDGGYFAVITRETNGILVWDVTGKKELGRLPLNDEQTAKSSSLEILDFAGTKHFVAAGRRTPLWIWSVPAFQPLREIKLPTSYDKESITFSPGGRYMTLSHRESRTRSVIVYDLETGQEAGRIDLPEEIGMSGCKGMAFSPDGEELAGVWEFVGKSHLFAWNVADGKLAVKHSFQRKGNSFKGPGVQWFPDKSKWLVFGNDVIDRNSGGPIWSVPKVPGSRDEARLLDGDRIVLFGKEGRSAGVGSLDVPHDLLAKAANVVGAGGTVSDVNLPPLKKADWNGVREIAADGVAGGWKATADPAPQANGELMSGALNVDGDLGRMKSLHLARRDAGMALVHCDLAPGSRPQFGGLQGGDQQANALPVVKLDRYDVVGKRAVDSLTLTYPCDLQAFSPDGGRAAVCIRNGNDRIDVWEIDGNRHVAGFKPFVDEKSTGHRKVKSSAFVDGDHLLTLSSGNKLALWNLAEGKAVYAMPEVAAFQLTPGGRFLVAQHKTFLRLFDARTGDPMGDLDAGGSPLAFAVDASGGRLAAVVSLPNDMKVVVWDLANGRTQDGFHIPKFVGFPDRSAHWCGDDHLLVFGEKLIDLKHKLIVWTYMKTALQFATVSPDGRHWYLSGRGPATLTALSLPDDQARQDLAGRPLEAKAALKPGMKVGLNIEIGGLPNHQSLQNDLYREWAKAFRENGIEVTKDAELVLFARSTSKSTGKSETFTITQSRFGAPPPGFGGLRGGRRPGGATRTETVADSVVECRIVFGKGDHAYGEKKTSVNKVPKHLFGSRMLSKGETAEQHFSKTQQNIAAGFFRGYKPPAYVFETEAVHGFGRSQLVPGGARKIQ